MPTNKKPRTMRKKTMNNRTITIAVGAPITRTGITLTTTVNRDDAAAAMVHLVAVAHDFERADRPRAEMEARINQAERQAVNTPQQAERQAVNMPQQAEHGLPLGPGNPLRVIETGSADA